MKHKHELRWDAGDRSFALGDLRFTTVHGGGVPGLDPGRNCLRLYKTRALVEQYLDWFARLASPPGGGNLLELGLFDGGSVPFWFEILRPDHHVGIDLRPPEHNAYLDRYLEAPDRSARIELHWRTDQTDAAQLDVITKGAFGEEPLDLVIDDASHLYDQTLRSFELLYPRLRPGTGLYVIEDWAWSHWSGIEHEWRDRRPLSELIQQLVEVAGSSSHRFLLDLFVCSGFVAVRRSWTPRAELEGFSVESLIYRHPR